MKVRWVTAARASETANTPDFDQPSDSASALDITLAYHVRSKHHPFRFAPALGYMDWDTQPDPFRRFEGAAVLLSMLYHFTMGGPVDDPRLQTDPPYQHLARAHGREVPRE